MGIIVHLATTAPDTGAGSASPEFARYVATLALQSERLQTAVVDIGTHLRALAGSASHFDDPATQAEFHLKISTLRCQLLLASHELAKLSRLQAGLTVPQSTRAEAATATIATFGFRPPYHSDSDQSHSAGARP